MKKTEQSALIKQAAIISTMATQVNADVDMTQTINNLYGYQASLTLVKDTELAPFGKQAQKLVSATLKYLKTRSPSNLSRAIAHSEMLAEMMMAHMAGGK